MNQERVVILNESDSAVKNTSQQVSVIKWSGKDSTKNCKEKSDLEEDDTLPISKDYFISSYSVVKPNKSIVEYRCSFCEKPFKWHSHWKSHERTHTGEKPFECEDCGKSFARSDSLQCHKLTHIRRNPQTNAVGYKYPPGGTAERISNVTTKLEQSKLFSCDHCNRIFFSSSGLVKHMQVHKGKTNHVCEVCDMVFPKRSSLEVHSRVHTGIKPYRCNICTKAFSIYGNLKRHLLIHTGERPYKCSHCLNSFNNPSHLTRHIKKKHGKGNGNKEEIN